MLVLTMARLDIKSPHLLHCASQSLTHKTLQKLGWKNDHPSPPCLPEVCRELNISNQQLHRGMSSLVLSVLAYLSLSPTSHLQPPYKADTTPSGFAGWTLAYRPLKL